MHNVAPEDQRLAAAFNDDRAVPGRVPRPQDRAEAGQRRGIVGEGLELPRLDVGVDVLVCLQDLRAKGGVCLCLGCRLQPERRLPLVDMQDRVLEHAAAVRRQPAGVVGMDMGQDHIVDLIRAVARGLDIGDELPKRRPHQASGARVDQHQPVTGVDEEGIDRNLGGIGLEVTGQIGSRIFLADAFVDLRHRQPGGAVGQGGDLQISQLQAVEAGRLRPDQGRPREGGAGQGGDHRTKGKGGGGFQKGATGLHWGTPDTGAMRS